VKQTSATVRRTYYVLSAGNTLAAIADLGYQYHLPA
jgi:hypothetical protein